ncbi:protein kinase [Anaerolineales bacterium HSG24]|nr:protein kinase [Anaerolineales bacterium HSG24]
MLTVGQKLFEFDIVRKLGQGGFAAVFEAEDRFLHRRVAIKQLLVKKASDKNAVKRFVQEARVIAKLDHPNIVTIYGLRHDEHNFYMIMEYLQGGSLQDLIKKDGKLSLEQAVMLTTGICEGLAKIHAKHIFHRDIKAENILLTNDSLPKVIDFGIAHVPKAVGGMELTQAGFQPSTLLFSSPEQVKGETLDARSDVYQVGELLYYMLAGQHYINLDQLESEALTQMGNHQVRSQIKLYELLEKAICEDMPEGLKLLWREVGALTGIIERSLAKDTKFRFKDAGEFAATLKTFNIQSTAFVSDTHSLNIQNSRAYNKRGKAYASTRNYEQAIIDFNKAIKLDSQYAEAYNNRSKAHLMMGSYGQAVIDCYWALEFAPNFVATYVNRGIAFIGMRDYEQAIINFAEALKLDPDNLYALYNRGNAYIWMGQYKEAIIDFNQVLAISSSFVAAYVNRGVARTELTDYEAALLDFSQAIELNPDYVHAYYNRANLYHETRDYKLAVGDYSKVIALNPEHQYAYENRGDCYAALGNEDTASEDYTHMITSVASIQPKRLSVAKSMLMPSTPIEMMEHRA